MSLKITQVTKVYQNKTALAGIDWELEPEKIYGLLGRNGAGKSSLLNIIGNRSFSTSGSVSLDGESIADNEAALNRIYLTSEDNLFPGELKLEQCLRLTEAFYGDFDWQLAKKMAADFRLDLKSRFRKLSTGYRSIAKLIMAFCVPCDYIFLDEPVLGLDANHRALFYDYLLQTYSENPRTFVLSTHLIEEVANLIEEVLIIDGGRVLRQATTEEIQHEGKIISGPLEAVAAFTAGMEIIGREQLGGLSSVYVKGGLDKPLPAGLTMRPLNLQGYFVQLTNQKEAV